MAGETSAQFGQTIDFVICFHSKCALKRRSARDQSLKSTLGGSSAKLRVDGDFSPVGKIQRCRLDDRLWRLNGTWSQVLLPTKHDRRRILSPREKGEAGAWLDRAEK